MTHRGGDRLAIGLAALLAARTGAAQSPGNDVSLKPSPRLTLSTGPQRTVTRTVAQYITQPQDATATATLGGRYVFGTLDQTQLTMTTRVSLIITPRVLLQVHAQPLLAAGDYTGFKELTAPPRRSPSTILTST